MVEVETVRQRLFKAGLPDAFLQACLSVTDSLAQLDEDSGRFLTLSYFIDSRRNHDVSSVLAALTYLSSIEPRLLSSHAYLEDNGGIQPLEDDDLVDLVKHGSLVHPVSGEVVPDAAKRVHLFYRLHGSKE
ncbi:MAG: hypothetical protein MUE52_05310 [Tabrizicola sp.]|jgi:hypothetical protein|nr:hypothetical protein [Tabrizicola sp.]